jgi:hypothetical protein
MLILFPFALVAVGLASREGSSVGAWQAIAVMTGPLLLMSAGSAAGSLMLARMGEDRAPLEPSADVDDVGLTDAEAKELLGAGDGSVGANPARGGAERGREPARRSSDS